VGNKKIEKNKKEVLKKIIKFIELYSIEIINFIMSIYYYLIKIPFRVILYYFNKFILKKINKKNEKKENKNKKIRQQIDYNIIMYSRYLNNKNLKQQKSN
jgi:uncharacterized membrane protein